MKRIISGLMVLCVLVGAVLLPSVQPHASSLEGAPEISAVTAVLMDADTGEILYDKNMHTVRYPASITKIMTAWLSVEALSPDQTLTVSATALDYPTYGTNVGLGMGEQLSVRDALYALMLPSANDAANVLAEAVAGTQQDFVQLMNRRAQEVGARRTQFNNAHGLPDDLHYTTAYDMALITRGAMRNPEFMRYFGAAYHTIPTTNLNGQRELVNLQFMLLDSMGVYNPYVVGGKVGYTTSAQHTLATAAVKDGTTLISVVMGCGRDEKFHDTQALLDYGFGMYAPTIEEDAQPERQEEPAEREKEQQEPAEQPEGVEQPPVEIPPDEPDAGRMPAEPADREHPTIPEGTSVYEGERADRDPDAQEHADEDPVPVPDSHTAPIWDNSLLDDVEMDSGPAALPYQSGSALQTTQEVLFEVEGEEQYGSREPVMGTGEEAAQVLAEVLEPPYPVRSAAYPSDITLELNGGPPAAADPIVVGPSLWDRAFPSAGEPMLYPLLVLLALLGIRLRQR